MRIVLDTNGLIASLSKRGNYFNVWRSLHEGKYTLCVSNEILEEYEEIISQKTNDIIASNVIQTLINSDFIELIDPHYKFNLIKSDPDDNKFVDCAIAANASYVVTDDAHFNILRTIPFPTVRVWKLIQFSNYLKEII